MKQLPVFSASPLIPEFDRPDDLRAAVASAAPTLGRLSTGPVPVRGAAPKRPAARQEPAGFSMSGFG